MIHNDYFTDKAWLQKLMTDADAFDCTVGFVTFEAGCRNDWRSHLGEQILLVTSGEGYYQEEAKPIQLINTGDAVEIRPMWCIGTEQPPTARWHISLSADRGADAAEGQGGIHALLNINSGFYPSLFDFTEPWKIDIMEFMNANLMCDLSMEEIASFTGRSLTTFKRDFQRVSEVSPQKWLINKRFEAAHEMLHDKKRSVTDVYMEVGFRSFFHFSQAFRKQYGVVPSEID